MSLSSTAGAAGTALQMFGTYRNAKATDQAYKYNAKIAEQNAILDERKAQFAIREGEQKVATSQLETRAKVGALEANQGASGVRIGEGSFGQVQESVREIGLLDAMQIRSNAIREAYGYQVDAQSNRQQAILDRYAGKNAKITGYINMASQALQGGSTLLNNTSGGGFSSWQSSKGLGANNNR